MGHDRNSRMPLENAGIDFTRRGLLQRAAWLTAAAAFPCAAKLAAEDVSPVMSALSNYMSEARNRELPENGTAGRAQSGRNLWRRCGRRMLGKPESAADALAYGLRRSAGGRRNRCVAAGH